MKQHPYPSDFQMFPGEVKEQWRQWVNHVPVIGLNSSKYDINMVKEYFMKEISYNKDDECNEGVFAVEKENDYIFLTTSKFKFLDVKNYIGPGLIYDAWCKPMVCRLQKLMFSYEWLDSYKKLSHVGSVSCEDFYSSLKSTIARDEYEQFFKMFKKNDCITMGDWLRAYNVADVVPFIEAFRKLAEQYYPDKIIHVYGEKSKLKKGVIGYDADALYLYCSGDVMSCGKDTLVVNDKPFDQKRIANFSKDVLKGKVFGFAQVDIEAADELYDKFKEIAPVFLVQQIPDCDVPQETKIYKEKTGRKTVKGIQAR